MKLSSPEPGVGAGATGSSLGASTGVGVSTGVGAGTSPVITQAGVVRPTGKQEMGGGSACPSPPHYPHSTKQRACPWEDSIPGMPPAHTKPVGRPHGWLMEERREFRNLLKNLAVACGARSSGVITEPSTFQQKQRKRTSNLRNDVPNQFASQNTSRCSVHTFSSILEGHQNIERRRTENRLPPHRRR